MTRTAFALLLVLVAGCSACAAPTAERWEREQLEVCRHGEPYGGTVDALDVWRLPDVPPLFAGSRCDIDITVGDVGDQVAVTRTWKNEAGEIRFAMIVLSERVPFGDPTAIVNADPDAGVFDEQSILVHELGHALGLEDVEQPGGAMFHNINRGEVRRRITWDDARALMELYE